MTGATTHAQATALQAFWPGMQVMAGDVEAAAGTHARLYSVWRKYGVFPERFMYRDAAPEREALAVFARNWWSRRRCCGSRRATIRARRRAARGIRRGYRETHARRGGTRRRARRGDDDPRKPHAKFLPRGDVQVPPPPLRRFVPREKERRVGHRHPIARVCAKKRRGKRRGGLDATTSRKLGDEETPRVPDPLAPFESRVRARGEIRGG